MIPLRAVLAKLPGVDGRGFPMFGLSLRDHRGHERTWLGVDGSGPVLGFDQAGQNVIYLGVNDADSDMHDPGPYFSMCDREGAEAIGWRVGEEGGVTETRPER